jgi:hypothetical protein
MSPVRERHGFALALAVCLLAAIGALAGANSFAIREAQRTATRVARQGEAATAADRRLVGLIAAWDAPERDTLGIGNTDSAFSGGGDAYVTRVTNDLYTVAAVGRSGSGTSAEARRGHSLLVRIARPALALRAAIVSQADAVVAAEASLSGQDRPPPGWEGCPPPDSAAAPAVLLPEGRTARYVDGRPLVDARADSLAAAPNTYHAVGQVATAFLAQHADIVLGNGVMVAPRPADGDKCGADNDIASWGEPLRSIESPRCRRYFPVIHAAGDIVVTAGRGQGVLLVDGRLRLEGPFVFAGLVLARDGVETSGASVSVYGAVLSGGASGTWWAADGRVQRSTCAVFRALAAAARPVPVSRGGWSELF